MHPYIHAYIHACMHADMQTRRYADMQTCRHADMQNHAESWHPLVAPSWDLGAPAPGVHGYFFLALVKMTIGICRHARFYLDHKCEINSKRLDPPRSPQGYSLPKRTQGGVQPLGFYLTPISGQAPWFYLWKVGLIEFYFHPTWDLVPIFYFQMSSPSI